MAAKHVRFQPYKSRKNGKWYWRVRGKNGKKICTGNEDFTQKPGLEVLYMLKRNIAEAILEEEKKAKRK